MRYFLLFLLFIPTLPLHAQTSPAYVDTVFTEYFRRTAGWTAGDATISVPLPCENKVLWLFGDSHIDGYHAADTSLSCLFQVRNAMLVQDRTTPSEFTTILDQTGTGVGRTPVKMDGNKTSYFWPGHGYVKGDTAMVFWQQYQGAGFEHTGNYISRIYTPGLADASAVKALTRLSLPDSVEFGVSVVVDSAANYLYIYGHKKDWIILRPLVARCPLTRDITGPWEFFDGTKWTSDASAAAQLMASTSDYVSASYSVIKLQGKYYMISQDIGFLTCSLGREIYSWESDTPYGPFTNKKLLYTIEDKYQGEYLVTYNATAHPEFIKDNELLISYNVNGFDNSEETSCENECEDPLARRNADGYRPKFIRVPLDYIDPSLQVPDATFASCNNDRVTGIDREDINLNVTVYPNPSHTGAFSVTTNRPAAGATVLIRDITGRVVHRARIDKGQVTLQLSHPGVYFIQTRAGASQQVSKVVIR